MNTTRSLVRPAHRPSRPLEKLATRFGLDTAIGTSAGVTVTGVAASSDEARSGDLFIAVPGQRHHGASFAEQAAEQGARAVLTDPTGVELARASGLPVLSVADPRAAEGDIAAWVYGKPAEKLLLIGTTGTNGKTTSTYMINAALRTRYPKAALMGTVELRVGDESVIATRTTAEAPFLQGMFAAMNEEHVEACTLEVSSHALALHRVDGFVFDIAIFTNLQREHLDFHHDMQNYFETKAMLFTPAHARRAVICVDDEWGIALAEQVEIPADTFAAHEASPGYESAQWRVSDAHVDMSGLTGEGQAMSSNFTLHGPEGERVRGSTLLPGSFNISNAVGAIIAAYRAGIDIAEAAKAVALLPEVPGRMSQVQPRRNGRPLSIVDYAHTPDALRLVLSALRDPAVTPGRLIHVFGSDGDRDKGKRPIMGGISAEHADIIIVTDENPYYESPEEIRAQVLRGARDYDGPRKPEIREARTRREAIATAVGLATESDTIVITGKGHEKFQEIAGVRHPQTDTDVLQRAIVSQWGPE